MVSVLTMDYDDSFMVLSVTLAVLFCSLLGWMVSHLLLAIVFLAIPENEDLLRKLCVLRHELIDHLLVPIEFLLNGLCLRLISHDLLLSAPLLAADTQEVGAPTMTLRELVKNRVLTVSRSLVSFSLSANSVTIVTASFRSFSTFFLRSAMHIWTHSSNSSFFSEWSI